MIPVSDESTAATKASKTSKDSKAVRETKETKDSKKAKDDSADIKGTALLRRMAEDLAEVTGSLARLRADVDALKQPPAPTPRDQSTAKSSPRRLAPASRTEQVINALAADADVAVTIAIRGGADSGDSAFVHFWEASELSGADSARLAKIAYAFSSAPKVALLRLLLDQGEQSAAQLGEKSGLTTGSLYHHLRELVHAEVAHPSGKNRYALTDLGRRTALALLALAAS